MLNQFFKSRVLLLGLAAMVLAALIGCSSSDVDNPDVENLLTDGFDPQEILDIVASDSPTEAEIARVRNLTDEQIEQIRQFVGLPDDTDDEFFANGKEQGIVLLGHPGNYTVVNIKYDPFSSNAKGYSFNPKVAQDVGGKVCGGGDDYIATFKFNNFTPLPSALRVASLNNLKVDLFLRLSANWLGYLQSRVYSDGTVEACCGSTTMKVAGVTPTDLQNNLYLWLK